MADSEDRLLYVLVVGDPSEEEDDSVPGIYLTSVDPGLSEGDQREAVLDQFHDHVGIGMLEDFSFIVADEDGNILQAPDEYENGRHADKAQFHGLIASEEAPALVRALEPHSAVDSAP